MSSFSNHARVAMVSALLIQLTGCGGGGGSSPANSGNPPHLPRRHQLPRRRASSGPAPAPHQPQRQPRTSASSGTAQCRRSHRCLFDLNDNHKVGTDHWE